MWIISFGVWDYSTSTALFLFPTHHQAYAHFSTITFLHAIEKLREWQGKCANLRFIWVSGESGDISGIAGGVVKTLSIDVTVMCHLSSPPAAGKIQVSENNTEEKALLPLPCMAPTARVRGRWWTAHCCTINAYFDGPFPTMPWVRWLSSHTGKSLLVFNLQDWCTECLLSFCIVSGICWMFFFLQIRNVETNQCLDNMARKENEKVGIFNCHGMGGNQVIQLS